MFTDVVECGAAGSVFLPVVNADTSRLGGFSGVASPSLASECYSFPLSSLRGAWMSLVCHNNFVVWWVRGETVGRWNIVVSSS